MIQSPVMTQPTIGIIGFGRFGQLAAKHLRATLDVTVWDLRDHRKQAASAGVRWGSLQEAAGREFVLLAVPISELKDCLQAVTPSLREGALLLDCCSVKSLPVRWMLESAPGSVEVVGLHPLFGPLSGSAGVAGLPIVVCPGRTGRLDMITGFFEDAGLAVHVATPEEHDRVMARSLVLAHFLGRGLLKTELPEASFSTPSFDRLSRMVDLVRDDSTQLFLDMNRYNPFAAEERRRLLEALLRIHQDLGDGLAGR